MMLCFPYFMDNFIVLLILFPSNMTAHIKVECIEAIVCEATAQFELG